MKGLKVWVLLMGMGLYAGAQEVKNEELQLQGATLVARDIIKSASWYVRHLNFKVKKSKRGELAIIENGHFSLTVVTAKRTVTASQVKLPEKKERINGFYEIGFLCSDLDSLLYQYEGRGINIVQQPEYNEYFQATTVVLADPDGNRVRLFQATPAQKKTFNYFKAHYLAVTTSEVENSVRWYETHMGFEAVRNNNSRISPVSSCLMKRGQVWLELQEVAGRTMEVTELLSNQVELARLHEVSLGTASSKTPVQPITDNDGNKYQWRK